MDFSAINGSHVFLSLTLGVLPPLFWLWFWLKEDSHRPEPRGILMMTFFGGMAAVLIALPAEYLISYLAKKINIDTTLIGVSLIFLSWAFIEEVLKYVAAKDTAFWRKSFDEPIDALIYMITAALGFAAFENILFLLKVCTTEGMLSGIITGDLRFLGATLLHTATSAIVGASIAFSFFNKEKMKYNVIGGIILATILHFIFNYFIIKVDGSEILKIFVPLWIVIIVIIFIFEKVKRIKNNIT